MLTNVIENRGSYYAYETIDKAWALLMRSSVQVPGSAPEKGDIQEKLKLLVRRHDLLPKYGKMLFRLINEFQPKNIICAGAVSGMSLLYLAKADSRIPVFHYDGKPVLLSVTEYLLEESKVANVSVQYGLPDFSTADLENSFVVISYPEDPDRCREIIQDITRNRGEKPKAIIVNGIHHSPQMETRWIELTKQEFVRISLDFFTLGLAICLRGLQKENFVIRY
ncbi:hypothetical protein SD074_02890 [Prolixibacter sp. SD074]|nr:hypothetical protein SD074_02890 [Prolixibacter sp. SD074]